MQGLQLIFQLGGEVEVADQPPNALALLADHAGLMPRLRRKLLLALQLGSIALYERQRCADIV